MRKPRRRWKAQLDKRISVLWLFPWPLSPWQSTVGERHEREQADLALRWRRAYEARHKEEVA